MFSRIDSALANTKWIDRYDMAEVVCLPEVNFDHTLMLLCIYPDIGLKRPFNFHNMWCSHPSLISTVRNEWNKEVRGYPMYVVHMKLKLVKQALKELNKHGFGEVEAIVIIAKELRLMHLCLLMIYYCFTMGTSDQFTSCCRDSKCSLMPQDWRYITINLKCITLGCLIRKSIE